MNQVTFNMNTEGSKPLMTKSIVGNKITVLKYPNRKLYLPVMGSYINQRDVYSYIRDGYEITVINHADKRDITPQELGRMAARRFQESLEGKTAKELNQLLASNV